MKLKFESWIETSSFSRNAQALFEASVGCYKAQVYTASLLMSYLGFLTVLKDRVMAGAKPALFKQELWDGLINNLKNEDKWEESIYDASLQQEKTTGGKPATRTQDPVFVINDNLRNQIRYWKDRRNDCVHNKDNQITIAHVESFWAFLESNIDKITIEGGKVSLLNKFKRHYDRSYTAIGEDITPLVKSIRGAVHKSELDAFWADLINIVEDLFDYSNEIEIINKVLALNDDLISHSLIEKIKKDEKLLLAYINENPSLILHLAYDKPSIRNLWAKKVAKLPNAMAIYAFLLRNNLIPNEEIPEANALFIKLYRYPSDINDHYVLQANGFGNLLHDHLFVLNSKEFLYWKFMHQHSDIFVKYIEMYPLTDDAVRILCREFSKDEFFSWFVRDGLDNLFESTPSKLKEFTEIIAKLGLAWPYQLK